jgi:predicted AlkP superfamily phosphohydrolase/phosphomutase
MKNRKVRGVVPSMVNVRGIPYVISDSMPSISEESAEQTRAYRKDSCCCILDVAPTVLELMGVPVSESMEGRPIELISKQGASP